MSFNWFDLIVSFGILQGLVSSVLLIRRTKGNISRQLLIALLLVACLLSFKILLHTLRLWDTGFFRYFPLAIDLLIQPLVYLYVASLTREGFKWTTKHWLHFLPAVLFMVHALIVCLLVFPVSSLTQKDVLAESLHFNAVKNAEDYLSAISALTYGYLSLLSVERYRDWLQLNISDTNYTTLGWLKNILLSTGILGLVLVINIFLEQVLHGGFSFLHWQVFYIYLSALIYYLGFKALNGREMPVQLPAGSQLQIDPVARFTAEELDHANLLIRTALEEQRVFLDGELTLQKLAQELQLNGALVSAAINSGMKQTFRALINSYRVEEVKIRIADPKYAHLSMLGIALECGFNSEASFYRIFKSATGYAPKQYIKL